MRPFFTFFGGKYRLAPQYPSPQHDTIIEPFAGSAGYSVRHNAERVVLVEIDPTIVGVWRYLIAVAPEEVRSLPDITEGTVDDYGLHQEARDFVGFWMNKAMTGPCRTPSKWLRSGIRPMSSWGQPVRDRIASQLAEIRHWEVIHDEWFNAPEAEATWFVDPPYMVRGQRYRYSAVDYLKLGEWCRERPGQTIACENEGADWLPFKPFRDAKTARANRSAEVIWTGINPQATDGNETT